MEQDDGEPKAKGRRSYEIGPAGRRTAENLGRFREARGLSQEEMAAAVRRLGRPMNRSAISKTEDATRHIDVDDLVLFALVLRLTPNRLLMPRTAEAEQNAEITPDYQVSELNTWMWAQGERPLDKGFDAPKLQIMLEVDRDRLFVQENRPDRPVKHPLGDPLQEHPELRKLIMGVAREARRLGVSVQALHYALEYAYMWAGAE